MYGSLSQFQPGISELVTPLDINSQVVVCVNNMLVYQQYLADCTSNADCGPDKTCLAPPHWHEYTGLRTSGYVSQTACAGDAEAAKTFCLLDSNCTAVVAEYGLSTQDIKKACLYQGAVLPIDHSTKFTTFAKPPVQHIGHCVRHALFKLSAPAPAALERSPRHL